MNLKEIECEWLIKISQDFEEPSLTKLTKLTCIKAESLSCIPMYPPPDEDFRLPFWPLKMPLYRS